MRTGGWLAKSLAVVGAFLFSSVPAAQADTFQIDLNYVFNPTGYVSPTPFVTAVFDDSIGPNKVGLTLTTPGLTGSGGGTLGQFYFNLDSVVGLSISDDGGVLKTNNGIRIGADSYRADGDGYFDVMLDFKGSGFLGTASFTLQRTGLTVDAFQFMSAPGPSENSPGPFLAAAHIQQTSADDPRFNDGSVWIAEGPGTIIPLPAAAWGGLALFGLIGAGKALRRRRAMCE